MSSLRGFLTTVLIRGRERQGISRTPKRLRRIQPPEFSQRLLKPDLPGSWQEIQAKANVYRRLLIRLSASWITVFAVSRVL